MPYCSKISKYVQHMRCLCKISLHARVLKVRTVYIIYACFGMYMHAYFGVLLGSLHDLSPHSIHCLVPLALNWELPHDVIAGEDRFKVEP